MIVINFVNTTPFHNIYFIILPNSIVNTWNHVALQHVIYVIYLIALDHSSRKNYNFNMFSLG